MGCFRCGVSQNDDADLVLLDPNAPTTPPKSNNWCSHYTKLLWSFTLLLFSSSNPKPPHKPTKSSASSSGLSLEDDTTVLLLNLEKETFSSVERGVSSFSKSLVRFGLSEILAATRGFSEGRVLGRGALSCVYKGSVGGRVLRGKRRTVVAIKRLRGPEKECAEAFCRELVIAGSLRNRNIVPLLGFCIDKEGLFLVYKYVAGGSLDLHLHPDKNGEMDHKYGSLSWGARFKVALRTAQAIEYLHYGTDRCIVHRDIKPSNILLSSNRNPKLCDFGFATWTHKPSLPFLCENVKGTFGYLAPEYFQHGKLSDKTDVYAFGVVLLELITGQKPIDTARPIGDVNLVLWAKPLMQQGDATTIRNLVDPTLQSSSYNQSEMCRTMHAAAACLVSNESERPRITEVISMLSGEGEDISCKDFPRSGCFTQVPEPTIGSDDMSGHIALAMLGISDVSNDDTSESSLIGL